MKRRTMLQALGAGIAGASTGTIAVDVVASDGTESSEEYIEFGECEVFVMLIHFEDTDPIGPVENVEEWFFGDRPGIGASEESTADWWEQASYGKFTLTSAPGGVAGPYELPMTEEEYLDLDIPHDTLYDEGVRMAKEDGYDFDEHENNIMVAIRSGGNPQGGGGPDGTWDGVSFDGSLEYPTGTSKDGDRMGFFCHELGHALGLPHHYNEVKDYPLMSGSGTWSSPPSLLCAHEKNNIGPVGGVSNSGRSSWCETTDIYLRDGADAEVPMLVPPAAVVDENYRLWDGPADNGSRYLLEYRDWIGVDRDLDSPGLAVYYFAEETDMDYPLTAATAEPTGETFRSADDLKNPDAELELTLENVEMAYDCIGINDPDHRSVDADSECVYAIEIDLADIPPGATATSETESRIDARVSWADDADDISLELIAPDGTDHADSRGFDIEYPDHSSSWIDQDHVTFDVVRSASIDGDGDLEGGWKLRETVSGSDTVDYYRAVTHPTHELATTVTVDEATVESGTLEASVELAFGDGSPHDPGEFDALESNQFDLEIDGDAIDDDAVTIVDEDDGTYALAVDGDAIDPDDGSTLAVTATDRKAGVSHTTNTGTTTISVDDDGSEPPSATLDFERRRPEHDTSSLVVKHTDGETLETGDLTVLADGEPADAGDGWEDSQLAAGEETIYAAPSSGASYFKADQTVEIVHDPTDETVAEVTLPGDSSGPNRPEGVDEAVWEAVTDQHDPTDELTEADLTDAIGAYHDDEPIDGVEMAFDDVVELIRWHNRS